MIHSENPKSPANAGKTSTTLLDGLRVNAAGTWQRFSQTYRPVILYWVLKRISNRETANDVTQEVLLAVHKQISKFDREAGAAKFRSWLKTITLRKTADYFRAQKELGEGGTDAHIALGQVETGDEDSPNETSTELAILVKSLAAIMKTRFRETTWFSFWRTMVDGLDARQVADELNISHAAVRKNKSRVLEILQNELSHLNVMEFLNLEVSQLDDLLVNKRGKK